MTQLDKWLQAGGRRLQLLLRALMVLCAAGLLYSAATLIAGQQEYARGDAAYDRVRQTQPGRRGTSPAPNAPSDGPVVDFAALAQINPDVVAWLEGGDGIIDYPVVQGADNDHYLTHLFSGEPNKLGSLFVDYRVKGDFTDKNTVIYGHNMKDGSMFASLTGYQSQSYYDSKPVMRLYTPQGAYDIQLFAGILAGGDDAFIHLSFQDDADFLAYTDSLKAASTFQSDIAVGPQDRIITLSTCSYDFDNARYALFGRLTEAARS